MGRPAKANKEPQDQRLKITQQWINIHVFNSFQSCAMERPDLDAHVVALEKHGQMIKVKMMFRNCGDTLFVSRLMNFVLIAMRDHYSGPHFRPSPGQIPVFSQPEAVSEAAHESTPE
jgi:hypothetical protein